MIHFIYLVKIENQIKLTNIMEVFVQYLNEVMNSFQVAEIIVVHIDANTKVQASISTINNFEITKLENRKLFNVRTQQ